MPDIKSPRAARRRRRLTVIIAASLLVIVIAGVAIYLNRIAPFRMEVVTVDERGVTMRTFLRRTTLSGLEPSEMLGVLVDELIVTIEAPNPPYRVEVTEADLQAFLRESARGEGAEAGDAAFREWYRRQINESRMPEAEFRDYVRTRLLVTRFEEYLAERVPTVTEQVRVRMFPVTGIQSARAAKARIEAGEPFGDVAVELTNDAATVANRGEVGWQARAGLPLPFARLVFDELETMEVSDPFFISGDTFAIVQVVERAPAREVEPELRRQMEEQALENWLREAYARHDVSFYGIRGGGYSAETDAWVRWQLDLMNQ